MQIKYTLGGQSTQLVTEIFKSRTFRLLWVSLLMAESIQQVWRETEICISDKLVSEAYAGPQTTK